MGPWIDRKVLVSNAKRFVQSYGYLFRKNAKRISSLVEIAVYNSLVQYYKAKGFVVRGENLGPKKSFKYKLMASGLFENLLLCCRARWNCISPAAQHQYAVGTR